MRGLRILFLCISMNYMIWAYWKYEVVDTAGNVGAYSSIAVDHLNRPHISYYDALMDVLKHAYRENNAWYIEIVDSETATGRYTHIECFGDSVGILYFQNYAGLKFALLVNGVWRIDTVEMVDSIGASCDFEFDVNGNPHVSYFDKGLRCLKYAYFDGSQWHVEIVDTLNDAGYYNSIAFNENGSPIIVYCRKISSQQNWLMTAEKMNDAWVMDTLRTSGISSCLTLETDSFLNPCMAYKFWNGNTYIIYSKRENGQWNSQSIGGFLAADLALSLDKKNNPHIMSYYRSRNYPYNYSEIQYHWFTGTEWKHILVDSATGYGWYNFAITSSSIDVDTSGSAFISYKKGGDLIVAEWIPYPYPMIWVEPQEIFMAISEGGQDKSLLKIGNSGDSVLTFVINERPPVSWMDEVPVNGNVEGNTYIVDTIIFNAIGLPGGYYYDTLEILTNDPVTPVIEVPVKMFVIENPLKIEVGYDDKQWDISQRILPGKKAFVKFKPYFRPPYVIDRVAIFLNDGHRVNVGLFPDSSGFPDTLHPYQVVRHAGWNWNPPGLWNFFYFDSLIDDTGDIWVGIWWDPEPFQWYETIGIDTTGKPSGNSYWFDGTYHQLTNGDYLVRVRFWGTRYDHDVKPYPPDNDNTLDVPETHFMPMHNTTVPRASFKNLGNYPETFSVTLLIDSMGVPVYSSTKTVQNLLPDSVAHVIFSPFTVGDSDIIYTAQLYTSLASDEQTVYDTFYVKFVSKDWEIFRYNYNVDNVVMMLGGVGNPNDTFKCLVRITPSAYPVIPTYMYLKVEAVRGDQAFPILVYSDANNDDFYTFEPDSLIYIKEDTMRWNGGLGNSFDLSADSFIVDTGEFYIGFGFSVDHHFEFWAESWPGGSDYYYTERVVWYNQEDNNVITEIKVKYPEGSSVVHKSREDRDLKFEFDVKNSIATLKNRKPLIVFHIPYKVFVTLSVYDPTGRKIVDLMKGEKKRGVYKLILDYPLSKGVYFVKFKSSEFQKTEKLVILND